MSEYAEITLVGCCCEGGGARGLVKAGHYVVGVDTDPSCREGFLRAVGEHGEFICDNILDVLDDQGFLTRFTYGDFGPPCQGYSVQSQCRPGLAATYPRLIGPIRERLTRNWGRRPYVIENVEGAREHMLAPVTFCMWMFGRHHYRHRLIEAGGGFTLTAPEPPAWAWSPPPGYVRARTVRKNQACGWPHPVPTQRAGHWQPGYFVSVAGHERKEPVRSVMEINWMSDREAVAEAIPPYLAAEIARQLANWRYLRTLAWKQHQLPGMILNDPSGWRGLPA